MKVALKTHPSAKADKKKEPGHGPSAFATQLAQAQALVPHAPLTVALPPHGALKHAAPRPATARAEAPDASHAPRATQRAPLDSERPAPARDSSAHPAASFSLLEAPPKEPARAEMAPPPWVPKELALDDTARLAIFPHAVSFVSEGQSLTLQVKNGEVSIRAQGELAAALKSSEAELRVALAQEGLKLRETDGAQPQQHDDATSDDRRRDQQERADEWT